MHSVFPAFIQFLLVVFCLVLFGFVYFYLSNSHVTPQNDDLNYKIVYLKFVELIEAMIMARSFMHLFLAFNFNADVHELHFTSPSKNLYSTSYISK